MEPPEVQNINSHLLVFYSIVTETEKYHISSKLTEHCENSSKTASKEHYSQALSKLTEPISRQTEHPDPRFEKQTSRPKPEIQNTFKKAISKTLLSSFIKQPYQIGHSAPINLKQINAKSIFSGLKHPKPKGQPDPEQAL